jgi:hypothetical protein
MAHANLHMAVGMTAGVALTIAPVARAFLARAPLARPLGRMLVVTYALGVWALVPNLVTAAGGPPQVHHAGWANIFLAHPLIDARKHGGLLIGELVMVAILVLQYGLLITALSRRSRRGRGGSRPSGSDPSG